jgi:hypothetical protein
MGLDREQMRQVFINAGKPAPQRAWPTMPTIPTTTLVLVILLALTILVGLGSLGAWGAEAGTVKKGSGGPAAYHITPLEKLEIISPPGDPSLYNFLQNFTVATARAAPSPTRLIMPESPKTLLYSEFQKDHRHDEPFFATIALALLCIVVLWLHLRARGAEADRNWRKR